MLVFLLKTPTFTLKTLKTDQHDETYFQYCITCIDQTPVQPEHKSWPQGRYRQVSLYNEYRNKRGTDIDEVIGFDVFYIIRILELF